RADERESPLSEVGAHPVRLRRPRRNLTQAPPSVQPRAVPDETPDVSIERPELLLDGEERARVADARFDFCSVPNDSGIRQEPPYVAGPVDGHLRGIESIQRLPVILPLPQDRQPGEARLRPVQDEELEQSPIVVLGDAPLRVVV